MYFNTIKKLKIMFKKDFEFFMNIFSLIILQGGQYVLTLATLPYLARVLSPIQFGIYGFSLAIAQYCMVVTNYGFDLSATKEIAINKSDKEKISIVFWNVLAAKLFLAILCIIVLIIFCVAVDSLYEYTLIIMLASTQVIGSILFPNWFFQGIEKLWGVTISNLFARAIGLALFFYFVKDKNDLIVAVVIQSLITILSGVIGISIVFSNNLVKKSTVSISLIVLSLKKGLSFFISNIAISFYTVSTVIILGFISSPKEAGLFNGVDKIRMAVTGIFIIMNGVIYPRINSMLVDKKEDVFKFIKKVALCKAVMTLVISLILYMFSSCIVVIILGKEYIDAVIDMEVMSPIVFLVTMSVVMANYILLPFGHKKVFVSVPIAVAFIHIFIAVPLCYFYGAFGGSIAIFVSELITNIVLIYFVVKNGLLKKIMES